MDVRVFNGVDLSASRTGDPILTEHLAEGSFQLVVSGPGTSSCTVTVEASNSAVVSDQAKGTILSDSNWEDVSALFTSMPSWTLATATAMIDFTPCKGFKYVRIKVTRTAGTASDLINCWFYGRVRSP